MAYFTQYCDACAMREACEFTFGKFWRSYKSSGGKGCNKPLEAVHREAILNAKRIAECAESVYGKGIKPADVPLQTATAPSAIFHKWFVTHDGSEYTTAAKTEREAINNIRFKLYGRKPLEELPAFSARMVTSKGTISKLDAIQRLKLMAR